MNERKAVVSEDYFPPVWTDDNVEMRFQRICKSDRERAQPYLTSWNSENQNGSTVSRTLASMSLSKRVGSICGFEIKSLARFVLSNFKRRDECLRDEFCFSSVGLKFTPSFAASFKRARSCWIVNAILCWSLDDGAAFRATTRCVVISLSSYPCDVACHGGCDLLKDSAVPLLETFASPNRCAPTAPTSPKQVARRTLASGSFS